jgi:hypothetical protein
MSDNRRYHVRPGGPVVGSRVNFSIAAFTLIPDGNFSRRVDAKGGYRADSALYAADNVPFAVAIGSRVG